MTFRSLVGAVNLKYAVQNNCFKKLKQISHSKMQEMDVDEDIFGFLPSVLRKYMIYHGRVYTNATSFTDFIITGGKEPVLYEVKGKQILSSVHLNSTIIKGIFLVEYFFTEFYQIHSTGAVLPKTMSTDDSLKITFNAYYSYKKKEKEQFLFLHMYSNLVILGRVDKHLVVSLKTFDIISSSSKYLKWIYFREFAKIFDLIRTTNRFHNNRYDF